MADKLSRALSKLSDEEVRKLRHALESPGEIEDMLAEIDLLVSLYSPESGWLRSKVRKFKSNSRAELLSSLNQELTYIVENWKLRDEATLLEARSKFEKLMLGHQIWITQLAANEGMTVESYQKRLLGELEVNNQLRLMKEQHQLKMTEQEKQAEIDRAKITHEYSEKAKYAVLSKLIDSKEKVARLKASQAPIHELQAAQEHVVELEQLWETTFSKR